MKRAWDVWERFWFEAEAPARIRAFGLVTGLTLLVAYAGRVADLELFYSEKGILTLGAMREVFPRLSRYSILELWPTSAGLWVAYAGLLGSLALLAAGRGGRWAATAALLLHVSFVHRNLAVVYGVDLVACFFLFFLAIAGSGRGTLGSMGVRLAQVQICIIYGYSGFKKLQGTTWWSGDALWNSLANVEFARWDYSAFAHAPGLLVAGTFVTVLWEIYFPALIWIRPLRKPLLILGVALHAGIGLLMSIPFFAALMVASYALFLSENEASFLLRQKNGARGGTPRTV